MISIIQNQHADEDSNLTKILISKYLSMISFCVSLVNFILSVIVLYAFYKRILTMKRNNVICNGSMISLNSFDTEGYLRPNTEEIYDEVS
jgi:hypothetical protein